MQNADRIDMLRKYYEIIEVKLNSYEEDHEIL